MASRKSGGTRSAKIDRLASQVHCTLFFLLFVGALPINAAFTRLARWRLDVIEQTYAGSWCYRPGASPTSDGHCSNSTLAALLNAHVKNNHGAGLSIAYYDLADCSVIGGAGWANWDIVALPVGVCMSGQVSGLDDVYTTTCRFTVADNDHDTPASHIVECNSNRAQLRVADGCYTPPLRRPWFRLDNSTSAVLAIISLILALPLYGLYRRYRARRAQQARIEDEQALPLMDLGDGVVNTSDVDQDVSRSGSARAEGRI